MRQFLLCSKVSRSLMTFPKALEVNAVLTGVLITSLNGLCVHRRSKVNVPAIGIDCAGLPLQSP